MNGQGTPGEGVQGPLLVWVLLGMVIVILAVIQVRRNRRKP